MNLQSKRSSTRGLCPRPKVYFGLSKAREISYRSSIHKGPVGTELYVRMVKQSDTEAPKVDVYSFAVIMWQLKERALPYEG